MQSVDSDLSPTVFEALVVPHRSLTPRGVAVFVGVLLTFMTLVVLRFWFLGAWIVIGFSVLEVPLVLVLLAVNFRRARASELIMLNPGELTVTRTDSRGRRTEVSMPAAWLRLDHETRQGSCRLVLTSRGTQCEIGAFLHDAERASLGSALAKALDAVRNPSFDNPQLRED